jgi:hypothetical protein
MLVLCFSGYIRLGNVTLVYVWFDQFMSDYDRLSHVWSGNVMIGQIRTRLVTLGQVRPGYVSLGQANSFYVEIGQFNSD